MSHFVLLLAAAVAVEGMVVQLRARSEECFFVASNARRGSTCVVAWQTQFGAVLEIDVDIHDPRESLMYSTFSAPEGQTSFTANHGGRYRICFSNVNNGQYPKFVAFRIDCHEIPDAEELKAQPQQRECFFFFFFSSSFSLTHARRRARGRLWATTKPDLVPHVAESGSKRCVAASGVATQTHALTQTRWATSRAICRCWTCI